MAIQVTSQCEAVVDIDALVRVRVVAVLIPPGLTGRSVNE